MSSVPRPTSVTVVCWIQIIFGLFGLFGVYSSYKLVSSGEFQKMLDADPRVAAMMKDTPMPNERDILIGGVGVLVQIASAVMMLNGMGLGRWIYIAGVALGFVMGFISGNPILWMIPGLVITAIILFFLFRPAANAYFRGGA